MPKVKYYCVPVKGTTIYLTRKFFKNQKDNPDAAPQWAGGWPSIIGGSNDGQKTLIKTLQDEANEETHFKVSITHQTKLSHRMMYLESDFVKKPSYYYTIDYVPGPGLKGTLQNKPRSFFETDGTLYSVDLASIDAADSDELAAGICSRMNIDINASEMQRTKYQFISENQHRYLVYLYNVLTDRKIDDWQQTEKEAGVQKTP